MARADDFDTLRNNWRTLLTGGSLYSPTDPDFSGKFSITSVNGYWASMLKTANRASLWSDLAGKSDTATITSTYKRLLAMATAYASNGATGLYQNTALRADIISGLDWLYTNWYNETIPGLERPGFAGTASGYTVANWWDFQIGTPQALNDIVVLLYSDLSAQQITNHMNAIRHFLPSIVETEVTSTGANLMWKCKVTALRGVILKDASLVNHAITQLSNRVSSIFANVTKGDGFYADGSFIQHTAHPYTGGYGRELITDLCDFLFLFQSPPFAVTDAAKGNVFTWLRNAFDPVIYKGGVFDSVRGREVSRAQPDAHRSGLDIITAFLRAIQFAPPAEAAYYRSAVKYWLTTDTTYSTRYAFLSVYNTIQAKAVMNDPTVGSRGDLVGHYNFSGMDRVIHHTTGWAASLSMSSTRIFNYESISGENVRGWHQGDGMLQIANSDLTQYDNLYWPTIDSQRVPGTTVEAGSTPAQGLKAKSAKVGGVTDVTGRYGLAAMELAPAGSSTLVAKKAWFFSDNKVVALGSGITATGTATVESIVENRVLSAAGTNALSVNGSIVASPTLQSSPASVVNLSGVRFTRLAGNVANGSADVGYFFPTMANLKTVRETRAGGWRDINTAFSGGSYDAVGTNRYLTLWFDHGAAPTNGSYAYAILPNIDEAHLQAFAVAPDFSILENSSAVQAIRDENARAVGAVFWNAGTTTVGTGSDAITSNNVASVYVRTIGTEIQVRIADPTQLNTGSIEIELGRAASAVMTKSDSITVSQLSPTIKLSVNAAGLAGAPQTIRLTSGDAAAANRTAVAGQSATVSAQSLGKSGSTFQWSRNGTNISGATAAQLALPAIQPADTGLYTVATGNSSASLGNAAAIVGLTSDAKLIGTGTEFADIFHAGTGFTYDQILLGGTVASVTADPGQILRMSFIDLNDDIVQVEFSGAGTLSLVLDAASGPAAPIAYNQSTLYMKGHAGIVLAGADASTNLSVFSVGRANAANQALFRSNVTYDGVADLAFIAITSKDGKFGGLRAANASFFASKGFTGVYAPGVQFTGPVFVQDINASGDATPVLRIGAGSDVRITGGDMLQANGRAVQVDGITQLRFAAGSTSHGTLFPAQNNKARFEQTGVDDVTAQIVVNPTP